MKELTMLLIRFGGILLVYGAILGVSLSFAFNYNLPYSKSCSGVGFLMFMVGAFMKKAIESEDDSDIES